ncbi:MAG: late competence development ComFB family protein [Leptospiraceae bacterium]|nr:late competence development ComFB family protein [Leptospiraceae bacterium]
MGESRIVKLGEWSKEITNVVEEDLRNELKLIIQEEPNWGWDQISLQDVFGCAINQLPPVYIKKGESSDLRLSKDEIRNAIFIAMKRVKQNPIIRIEEGDSES